METNNRYGRRTPSQRAQDNFHGLVGYVVASYDELVTVFGKPTYVAAARERVKVAISWNLIDSVTGNTFTVYEYKSTTRYSDHPSALSLATLRRLPEFEWNIAAGRFDLDALQRYLSTRLGRDVVVKRS